MQDPEITRSVQETYFSSKIANKNDLCKPPNLSHFKNKMIQSLKNKESGHEQTVENLEK